MSPSKLRPRMMPLLQWRRYNELQIVVSAYSTFNTRSIKQHIQQHQQQQQQSKIVGVVEEESFDFTTINDKDFIASWMTMQNTILMDF